tara:strand:- start:262 stop:417 length:156 start_codon:yes stop_codon:yes gene_type:complete
MTNSSEEIEKYRPNAETAMNKTAQHKQALTHAEASLSKKESQKETEKFQIT